MQVFEDPDHGLNDEIIITNARHKKELDQAYDSLQLVIKSIDDGMQEDFFSIDLMSAYEHLGYIIGEDVGEDLVDEIFSKFCMGK
jgi:tRNA modification GTPase